MPARTPTGTRRGLRIAAVLAVLALAAFGWALWRAQDAAPAAVRLAIDDPARLARGEAVYRQHCAACHGARLEGQPAWRERGADGLLPAPPHDASGHTWHHPDAMLFAITKHGVAQAAGLADYRSAMPVYAGLLSDADIVAVLSWIKSQWPAEIRRRHDQLNAAAAEAAREAAARGR